MPDFLITAEALAEKIDAPGWRIIDCRFDLADPDAGNRMYREAHVAGAVFADLDRDLSAPPRPQDGRHPLPAVDTFERTLSRLGIANSTRVVVYDGGNGAVAARAWWMLRWVGHESVYLLDGGFDEWRRNGFPLRDGIEGAGPASYAARPRAAIVLQTDELARHSDGIAAMHLVDARDAVRFRGEIEPIDPVAGHIPGAVNLPLDQSLNPDGTWKPAKELRAMWLDVLGPDRDVRWSVMCGSGVTACHLAISGMLAGYREPRLYVGSWSEWIRDPGRPIAVGDDRFAAAGPAELD